MSQVSMAKAKAEFAALVSRAEAGESITVTRNGRPVACLGPLPIRLEHCQALVSLPPLHGDPFDRMLIAQSRSEQVPLLTRDRRMSAYGPFASILYSPA